jgi:hypothetical protein
VLVLFLTSRLEFAAVFTFDRSTSMRQTLLRLFTNCYIGPHALCLLWGETQQALSGMLQLRGSPLRNHDARAGMVGGAEQYVTEFVSDGVAQDLSRRGGAVAI